MKKTIRHRWIVPTRMIYRRKVYQISDVDIDYVCQKYWIVENDIGFDHIEIVHKHPNANPATNELCTPDHLFLSQVNPELIQIVENILRTFYLDECYYRPWDRFHYKL